MTRQDKYPETETFCYQNVNPKGRLGSDCAIRAVANAMGQSWEQTLREMTEIGIADGRVASDKETVKKYLRKKGWIEERQPRNDDGSKIRVKKFCEEAQRLLKYATQYYKPPRRIVAFVGAHHLTAIIDGKVHDIWDCTDEIIGNYWVEG